jgi:hypothetical protein
MKVSNKLLIFYCYIRNYHKCNDLIQQIATVLKVKSLALPNWILCLGPYKAKTRMLARLGSHLEVLGNTDGLVKNRVKQRPMKV